MRTASARYGIIIALVIAAAASALLLPPGALAQCAMCKATASNLDSVSARNLNLSTLILLCPPVAIFCAIFALAYKHRNPPAGGGDES